MDGQSACEMATLIIDYITLMKMVFNSFAFLQLSRPEESCIWKKKMLDPMNGRVSVPCYTNANHCYHLVWRIGVDRICVINFRWILLLFHANDTIQLTWNIHVTFFSYFCCFFRWFFQFFSKQMKMKEKTWKNAHTTTKTNWIQFIFMMMLCLGFFM